MADFRLSNDSQLKLLAFLGAFCGIAAGAGADVIPPVIRLLAGATAAGCAAVIALLRPPGMSKPPEGHKG